VNKVIQDEKFNFAKAVVITAVNVENPNDLFADNQRITDHSLGSSFLLERMDLRYATFT
jgi:hypothetical protein